MKLTLGTVQFGIQYGISNTSGIPSDTELKEILKVAQSYGIDTLDTALAYGNAEERLGEFSENQFKIITKFPAVASGKELKETFSGSLLRLKQSKIYGYLAHNADVLIQNPDYWKVLQQFKADEKVEKIGYSLYQPGQLEQLLSLGCIPDLVQLPYSILDRKFEKHLSVLKEMGTEIHVRSVFLQGLYFMNPMTLKEKLLPLQSNLQQFQELCREAGKNVGDVALNYAVQNPFIDQIVIGVESAAQLTQNITMLSNWQPDTKLFSAIEAIEIKDKTLLNPANW